MRIVGTEVTGVVGFAGPEVAGVVRIVWTEVAGVVRIVGSWAGRSEVVRAQ
jgi:hypothetical protein